MVLPVGAPRGTQYRHSRSTLSKTEECNSVLACHFCHVDHLNQPRLVTNAAQQAVWRHDQAEPFGNNPPDENPSGLGVFEFPLRDEGTYFDKETNLVYNWYRYRDTDIGRFPQADPLGLYGGDLSLYVLRKNNPLRYTDPHGLKVQQCCRKAEILFGKVEHCWIKTDTVTAGMASNPKCRVGVGDNAELPYVTDVYVSDHSCEIGAQCTDIPWDVDEECVNREMKIGTALGSFNLVTNSCQTFVNEVLNKCTRAKPPKIKK